MNPDDIHEKYEPLEGEAGRSFLWIFHSHDKDTLVEMGLLAREDAESSSEHPSTSDFTSDDEREIRPRKKQIRIFV